MFNFSRLSCLVLIAVSLVRISLSQQTDPLTEADKLFSNREYAEATEAYKELLARTSDDSTKARILLNLGKTYRMLKQYDLSIDSFKKMAELDTAEFPAVVNKRLRFPVYRPQAGVEISQSLFAKGDYAGALSVFRENDGTQSVNTGCGTCNKSIARQRNITEGIYLEALSRYDEAVIAYLKADEPRLAELYYNAGQLEDLRAFVEKDIVELMRKFSWRRDYSEQNSRYRNLIAMIKAYDLERQENWQELIKMAEMYDRNRDFGRNNIPATILARHADRLLPLLKAERTKFTVVRQMSLIYEILALSGTDESIKLLNELSEESGLSSTDAFLILGQIYRQGDDLRRKQLSKAKALTDIEPWARFFFERDDIDEFGRFEIKFPKIVSVPKLPRSDEILL